MSEAKTLTFTSIRPYKLSFGFNEDDPACFSLKMAVKDRLVKLIEEENVRHFITSMAMGMDMIFGETVAGLMTFYPGITLEVAAPHKEHDILWPQAYRDRYRAVLEKCSAVYIAGAVDDDCMEKRNKYMADKCDMVLAIWNGRSGGMGSVIKHAKKLKKPIIMIDPFHLPKE